MINVNIIKYKANSIFVIIYDAVGNISKTQVSLFFGY